MALLLLTSASHITHLTTAARSQTMVGHSNRKQLLKFVNNEHGNVPGFVARRSILSTPGNIARDESTLSMLLELRAGASDSSKKKKTSAKKKKKKTSGSGGVKTKEKGPIDKALKEKDAAEALGDAIRGRSDELRFESATERSVSSIGWALGASSSATALMKDKNVDPEEDGGGVEAAPTSVVAHYFLKSHGGAHALQCVCSLLATISGLGSLALLHKSSQLSLTLLKRCMLFAMVKHVSGLFAATFLTARAIPDVGLREARAWMEDLVTDPVSQYVFYTACILFWLPDKAVVALKGAEEATTIPNPALWWQSYPVFPLALVGPVVLRETVSTILVICDVLVLLSFSSRTSTVRQILQAGQTTANAVMSILVTPKVWKNADSAERQAVLAKLTSKFSLALEVAVGLLLFVDVAGALTAFTFGSTTQRPSLLSVLRRMLCTRLFVHFLWTRRRKINRLATSVRGGAAHLPMYMVQVLTQPRASLGLSDTPDTEASDEVSSWKDYIRVALGLDEDKIR